MTTKGGVRMDPRADFLRSLPTLIKRQEALGHPVIVELEPPVPEHVQRLYAALGVLVRFVE